MLIIDIIEILDKRILVISEMDKLYITIYNRIKKEITDGVYKSGTKLPSKRVCAERWGVSVVTVEHAYALLEDEGYISGTQRRGYFVIYNSKDFFDNKPKNYNTPILPLKEFNEIFPESVYLKTVRKVLADYGAEILSESENTGLSVFKAAISDYLFRCRGIKTAPDRIIIGSDASALYGIIISLLGGEKIFAIEDPSYKKIENTYKLHKIRFEKLRLETGGLNSEALKCSSAEVLHVTPYRSYPSGITATAAKRAEYIDWAKKRNGIIIEDDYGSEFYKYRKPFDTLFSLGNQNVIYLNTFSKTVSPAVKTGYLVLPETLTDLFKKNEKKISCSVPTLEQLVLTTLLNDGSFERNLNRIRRKIRKGEI